MERPQIPPDSAYATVTKPDPHAFTLRSSRVPGGHKGVLGVVAQQLAAERGLQWNRACQPLPPRPVPPPPPPTNVHKPRGNPTNSWLRVLYERGDLPCTPVQVGSHLQLRWRVPPASLDYGYCMYAPLELYRANAAASLSYPLLSSHADLPVFLSGLREEEHPLTFIAQEATKALTDAAPGRLLGMLAKIVRPLRECLDTRARPVMVRVLVALEHMCTACGASTSLAKALIPHYRTLLSPLASYVFQNLNIGDRIDYGQRRNRILGERIDALLQLLEREGGADAYPAIKYVVPMYTSRNVRR